MQTLHNLNEGSLMFNVCSFDLCNIEFTSKWYVYFFELLIHFDPLIIGMICFSTLLTYYGNKDELAGFEDVWRGNAREHLPGWNEGLNAHGAIGECHFTLI